MEMLVASLKSHWDWVCRLGHADPLCGAGPVWALHIACLTQPCPSLEQSIWHCGPDLTMGCIFDTLRLRLLIVEKMTGGVISLEDHKRK